MLTFSDSPLALALLLASSAPPHVGFEHEVQRHETRLSAATWEARNDAAACRLVHRIEGYGEAHFVQRVGSELELEIQSDMPQPVDGRGEVLLVPAAWRQRGEPTTLAAISVHAGTAPVSLDHDLARRLYSGLAMGHAGTVRFPTQARFTNTRELVINPVHFRAQLSGFDQCRQQLASAVGAGGVSSTKPLDAAVPEAEASIYFTTDSAELTASAGDKLDDLAEAFLQQPAGSRIQLRGFADPRGRKTYNRRLAEQRLFAVRYRLVTRGVPLSLVYVEAVGPTVTDDETAQTLSDTELAERRRVDVLFLDNP